MGQCLRNISYQFRIDNTGDGVEDLVIQAKFTGTGPNQIATVVGPLKPAVSGTKSTLLTQSGITAFCGAREDPFFFDLNQFFAILPDRAAPLTGKEPANPDMPQTATFNGFPGTPPATDFLAGYNVTRVWGWSVL